MKMIFSPNFHFKHFPFLSHTHCLSQTHTELDCSNPHIEPKETIHTPTHHDLHSMRERECASEIAPAHREREREREREEEERAHCRRPTSFDFTGNLETSRHEPRSLFGFAVWLRLQIAPRLHPLTSLANLEAKIARLRLRRLRTLRLCRLRTPTTSSRWHRDGTDRTNHTEFAIEKWLGFDEFDWVWWIFLVGFWWIWPDLCLSIEKLYYIFVWKLRKCEKM